MERVPLHSIDEVLQPLTYFLKAGTLLINVSFTETQGNKYMGNNFLKLMELSKYENPQSQIYQCFISAHD